MDKPVKHTHRNDFLITVFVLTLVAAVVFRASPIALVSLSLLNLYQIRQSRGPLTGTSKQRCKCFWGFHDWRLFAYITDPAWRLIWRCHWCKAECLTPDTHAGRVECDQLLPPYQPDTGPHTGATTRL